MEICIKHREVLFHLLHPTQNPAQAAKQLLNELIGVEQVNIVSNEKINISYNLILISFAEIEGVLQEVGFYLDNHFLIKLKRIFIYYTEETHRANLGYDKTRKNPIRDIFMSRYKRLQHGCRDERPSYWRNYL